MSESLEKGLMGARRVRQLSAPLKSTFDEKAEQWKALSISGNAHLWANYLEEKNPLLSKALLRTAAVLDNPYREVLGLSILHRSEGELVAELARPARGVQGLDTGVILTLANYVADSFWRQFLDLEHAVLVNSEQTLRLFQQPVEGPLRAKQNISETQREELFSKYRKNGIVALPVHIEVTDRRGIVVGEVDWQLEAERYKVLPPGAEARKPSMNSTRDSGD
jgi:hypothetical protein